jgi:hypothetical protein
MVARAELFSVWSLVLSDYRSDIGSADGIAASLPAPRLSDAAIHHPDALGLAILVFDFLLEAAQGRVVGGIAGQNFIR